MASPSLWSRTIVAATAALAHRSGQQPVVRQLHANRAAICRIKRPPNQYCRLYPVTLVYQDGSTVTTRYQVPREIIKLPFLYEDCATEAERKAWLARRKHVEVITIKKDDTDVAYNQMAYLKTMKKGAGGGAGGSSSKAKAKK